MNTLPKECWYCHSKTMEPTQFDMNQKTGFFRAGGLCTSCGATWVPMPVA